MSFRRPRGLRVRQRRRRETVASITKLGRVIIPVSDQDAAIAFYTQKLGFSVASDIPFGNGDRWVEVAPPSGGAAIALSRPMGGFQAGARRASLSRRRTPAPLTRS